MNRKEADKLLSKYNTLKQLIYAGRDQLRKQVELGLNTDKAYQEIKEFVDMQDSIHEQIVQAMTGGNDD